MILFGFPSFKVSFFIMFTLCSLTSLNINTKRKKLLKFGAWKYGRNSKWKTSARNEKRTSSINLNSVQIHIWDFTLTLNLIIVLSADTLAETCTYTNDKVSGFAYAFVFLLSLSLCILIQKFHFNPTGGFVLNAREKYGKTKAKSLKPIRWLIACNSNQLNRRLTVEKVFRGRTFTGNRNSNENLCPKSINSNQCAYTRFVSRRIIILKWWTNWSMA